MDDIDFSGSFYDSDDDGVNDTFIQEIDDDGDGNPDEVTVYSDTDGDHILDFYKHGEDENGDGHIEHYVIQQDVDGDKVVDVTQDVESEDMSGDGIEDTFVIQKDSNGDGEVDVIVNAHDYDLDGEIDSVTTYSDTDHDGTIDHVTKSYDSTGDGIMDKMDVYVDEDGSGEADYHQSYYFDPEMGTLMPVVASNNEIIEIDEMEIENNLDTYQPDEDYPDGISGDPVESMNYWDYQGETNRCALYSQMFVIEELQSGDVEIDIEEFASIAEDNGWFDWGGTTIYDMNKMLDYYGVDNEMTFHNSIDDMETCLNNGGRVIVSVDCDEIWYGDDDGLFSPYSGPNHAVEVIGIDRTDPENPMVILNDSGSPEGRGEMVPLAVFEGAWEDGDCQMVSCYPA